MRKKIVFCLAIIVFANIVHAQKTTLNEFTVVDKKASLIPDSSAKTTTGISTYIQSNFITDDAKVRAAFIWVASNLEYDVDNMFAINYYETQSDKINKALATKKGICENYATIFNEICNKCNIKSYVIEGYTKQNGFTDYIPHAWCAAYVDTAWYLFDVTWGSGYVNNGKFYKKINNAYFKAKPSLFIKDHMPFDYLWQFLNYPVTTGEFYAGNLNNTSKSYFDFKDSINVYEHLNHVEQLTAEARRIEANGIKNSMIFDRLQHIKIYLENEKISARNSKQNTIANFYKAALVNYNSAVKYLNDFIDYRNHQFAPKKTDDEIKAMLDSVTSRIDAANNNIEKISGAEESDQKIIDQLKDGITDIETHNKEQQDWLEIYLSKSQSKRKSLFFEKKASWFGIPIK